MPLLVARRELWNRPDQTIIAAANVSALQLIDLLGLLLELLLLLLDNVHHKSTAEENSRLVDVVMLVAVSQSAKDSHFQPKQLGITGGEESYLSVPTPPASRRNVGPSCSVWPTHRWAKARRMWP